MLPLTHAEQAERCAEIGRQGRVRLDLGVGVKRIREGQRRGVQHLPRNLHEARIADVLEAEHAVADDRIADGRQMTADLVRTSRLDANAQERGVRTRRLARHL